MVGYQQAMGISVWFLFLRFGAPYKAFLQGKIKVALQAGRYTKDILSKSTPYTKTKFNPLVYPNHLP